MNIDQLFVMSEAAEGFILLARVHQLVAQSVLAWNLGRLYGCFHNGTSKSSILIGFFPL